MGINYRHEAIIDLMLAAPHMNRNQIAAELGYTAAWLSTVCSSDAFRMRLNERRSEYEGDLNAGATARLHELDEAATKIIRDELAKTGNDVDPRYALEVKKIVQQNMKPVANHTAVVNNSLVLRRNTQINVSVLERARSKLLQYKDADADSDLFGEIVEAV